MTITITARRPATDPRVEGLGFECSDLLIDGFAIGIVIWPVNDIDWGMLRDAKNGKLRFPNVHPGGKPCPWVRFGSQRAEKVYGGISGIVTAVKEEVCMDHGAEEIAKDLRHYPWEFIEGFLCAVEHPLFKADHRCSATAIKLAIRRLNAASAPSASHPSSVYKSLTI